jgi:hypothetical protein
MQMSTLRIRQGLVALLLVAAGAIAGVSITATREAQAEIRATPQPQSFQSGGQLSVPVLKEIATTLRQIDSRLARLESVAQKMQPQRPATQPRD